MIFAGKTGGWGIRCITMFSGDRANMLKLPSSLNVQLGRCVPKLFPERGFVAGFFRRLLAYIISCISISIIPHIQYRFNTYPFNTYRFNTYPFNTYASAGMAMNVNTKHILASYASAGMAMNVNTKHILASYASAGMAMNVNTKHILASYASAGMAMNVNTRHIIASYASAGMAMNVTTKHILASYASAGMAMNVNTKHILASYASAKTYPCIVCISRNGNECECKTYYCIVCISRNGNEYQIIACHFISLLLLLRQGFAAERGVNIDGAGHAEVAIPAVFLGPQFLWHDIETLLLDRKRQRRETFCRKARLIMHSNHL